jgi:hypothetical protein
MNRRSMLTLSITSSARPSSIGGHHKSDHLGGAIGTIREPHHSRRMGRGARQHGGAPGTVFSPPATPRW